MALQDKFEADKPNWPIAKWATFMSLLFDDMQMQFKRDTHEIIEKLQQDLSGGGHYQEINLRKLRNQICRTSKPVNNVFGWGMNDERLCCKAPEEDELNDGGK